MCEKQAFEIVEGETPFEMALKAVGSIDPHQALLIERAITEGRLTIGDVVGFAKTKKVLQ